MIFPENLQQPSNGNEHQFWMKHALALAEKAEIEGEVPIGAIVVADNQIIGRGFNQPIKLKDPTAHAEIIALRQAAVFLQNYRLINVSLYVTLEPCIMCAGAMIHARIKNLIFGARDPRTGAVCSHFNLLDSPQVNHRVIWQEGINAETCSNLLKNFFKKKR